MPETATRNERRQQRTVRILTILIAAAAIAYLLLFLYCAVCRMRYPYEVEWIESGMLVSVLRVAHGQGLYVAPSLDFVPYLYAPLYFYVSAAAMKLTGATHGYAALRLVSTLSTLGSCGAIYLLVMAETRRWLAGVAAVGVFLGAYAVSSSFYDIGRVDSLFVMLLLWALLAQRRGYPIVAASLWVLTFQTKQSALPMALLLLGGQWAITSRKPRNAAGVAGFVVASGASIVWLDHATGGWYSFYVFHVAKGFGWEWRQAALYLPSLVLAPLAIAWVLVLAAVVLTRGTARSEGLRFYLLVSVVLLGSVWFVEAHKGASQNALMPVYAWTAVLFGVALARLLGWTEERKLQQGKALVLAGALAQLLALAYVPGKLIPTQAAAAQTAGFIAQLKTIPGDVYVMNHSYDALLAGKQPHAEEEALGAVVDANAGDISRQLRAQLENAVATNRYAAIVIDDGEPTNTAWHFERSYPIEISTELRGLRHFTSQPQWILLPPDTSPEVLRNVLLPDSVVAGEGRGNAALRTSR